MCTTIWKCQSFRLRETIDSTNPKSIIGYSDADSLIPAEVKAGDKATPSLNNLISKECYKDIHYGIKICNGNSDFNKKFYTFPYFCAFLLKRFILETKILPHVNL